MRLFRRNEKSPEQVAPPQGELPAGERIERSVKATLLQGTQKVTGSLYLTDRRLLFEAGKAAAGSDARYMSVPFGEMREAGLYRWHHAPMGRSSLSQCLCVVTMKGEQVWWDFGEQEERAWLPLVQSRIETGMEPEADEA